MGWIESLITKDAILGAVVGAIVGAILTYRAQLALDNRRQNQKILGALKGIYVELNTNYKQLASQYEKEKWKNFKKSDPKQHHLPPLKMNFQDMLKSFPKRRDIPLARTQGRWVPAILRL